jgi:hypothetical protein
MAKKKVKKLTDNNSNIKIKKPRKNHYFTKEHEQAIIDYVKSSDGEYREELYISVIAPVLSEMVDKIIYTYKFTSLPNIDCLKEECKVWLVTILDKFEPDKGFKAFSYFSVVSKNWFIHRVKKCALQSRKELIYDELPHALEQSYMIYDPEYEENQEKIDFWEGLKEEIEYWANNITDLKPNEQLVLNSILVLMANAEDIEIFNKKAIYVYLREISGLSSKQIVQHLVKLRERYAEFKTDWDYFNY